MENSSTLVHKIYKNLKNAKNHVAKWRKQAMESYDFFAGDQWSTSDVAKLEETGRQPIVFNRTVRVVNAIAGLELQNRQQVSYVAREPNDNINAELLTNAARWVRDNCDAEDEESQAFKDLLITGVSCIETRLDYESDPDGTILIDRVDPLEMLVDPASRKRNFDDARFIARVKKYSKTEFKELWPDKYFDVASQRNNFLDDTNIQAVDNREASFYRGNNVNDDQDFTEIEVVQYQYFERETYYRVFDGDKVTELDTDKYKKMKDWFAINGIEVVKQTRRKYKQKFLCGMTVLEEGDSPVNAFTFRFMTGLYDRNNNTWFGIMRIMKDPQSYANKWLSQIMFIINSNAKGGYFYEANAVSDTRKFADDLSRPDKNVQLNPGGLGKIQPKTSPPYPEGIDRLLGYAVTSINDIVGVNLEMLGIANRDQAGILEMQRKEAGITVLADFFDAIRRYRKEQGRVLAQFVLEYISDGRLIKINGQESAQYVPIFRETFDFKFDVIVEDSPTSPNQKERTFLALSSMLPGLIQAGFQVPPEILDYAPLPAALTEKWKNLIQDRGPSELEKLSDQIKAQLAQLEVAKKSNEVKQQEIDMVKTTTEVDLNVAKAQHERTLSDDDSERKNFETISKIYNTINKQ